jgi:hypothetical protein
MANPDTLNTALILGTIFSFDSPLVGRLHRGKLPNETFQVFVSLYAGTPNGAERTTCICIEGTDFRLWGRDRCRVDSDL